MPSRTVHSTRRRHSNTRIHWMKKPRVLIADNYPLVLDGFRRLLERDYKIVGTVRNGQALLAAAKQRCPDLVLLDINLPVLNGFEAAKRLQAARVETKIMFISMHASPLYVVEAIKAGASGYLLKTCELKEVRAAIKNVLAGGKYITPAVAHSTVQLILDHPSGQKRGMLSKLTVRQKDVLRLLSEGKALKEIADTLHVSVKTVEFHKRELCQRVGLRTTAELTRLAVAEGLISADPQGALMDSADEVHLTSIG